MTASFDALTTLLCSERSGSNLITRIMDSHPLYCGPAPSHLVRTFSNNRLNYGDLAEDANWRTLLQDVADFLAAQLGEWRTRVSFEYLLKEVYERSLAAIIRCVYGLEAAANGKHHIFLKENQSFGLVSFLTVAFPQSRFVYQVRDPRDMALSWKLSPNHPGGVRKAAAIWREDQAQTLKIYGHLMDTNKILLLRYEDLISNPQYILKALCHFLEIEFFPSMLSYHQDELTVKNSERIQNWGNLSKPIMQNNQKKYRGKLSETEIRYIEHYCQNEMAFLGYPLDYDQSIPLIELEQALPSEAVQIAEEPSLDEKMIREKRLAIIQQILARRL